MSKHLVAADIGGTNSRFAHFVIDASGALACHEVVYLPTADHSSFGGLLGSLKASTLGIALRGADIFVIAAAGPVENRVYCRPPNIEWEIDLRDGGKAFGLRRFLLINDFLAQAFACLSPLASQAINVIPGCADPNGAIAAIGPGTGLGKALLLPDGRGGYVGSPSEGGHENFCPESEHELTFGRFVAEREGEEYATWDDVVSGRGLSYLHEFLGGERLAPKEVAAWFAPDSETLAWFSRFCARVCRNFALDVLALGGVYVVGGIAAKNPVILKHAEFSRTFHSSKAHADLLAKIPVFLIDNQESGLWGAAYRGRQLLLA
jgi:glucokinase